MDHFSGDSCGNLKENSCGMFPRTNFMALKGSSGDNPEEAVAMSPLYSKPLPTTFVIYLLATNLWVTVVDHKEQFFFFVVILSAAVAGVKHPLETGEMRLLKLVLQAKNVVITLVFFCNYLSSLITDVFPLSPVFSQIPSNP